MRMERANQIHTTISDKATRNEHRPHTGTAQAKRFVAVYCVSVKGFTGVDGTAGTR